MICSIRAGKTVDIGARVESSVNGRAVVGESENFFRAVVEAGYESYPVFEFGGGDIQA